MRTLLSSAATLAALLAIAPVAAVASTEISGSPHAVSVKAQNSSIEEILSLLGHEFNLQFHSTANLEKQLTGTYQGSLQRVLTRVLEGYNFVVKTNNGRIEVTVFGTKSAPGTAVAAMTPAATTPAAMTPAATKVASDGPTVEAKTQVPAGKAVEQPSTSSLGAGALGIKVADATRSNPAASSIPTSPATGPGLQLLPAMGPAPTPVVDGAATAANVSPSPSSQGGGPVLDPASPGTTLTPTPAPEGSGPAQGSASPGSMPMPTPSTSSSSSSTLAPATSPANSSSAPAPSVPAPSKQ